MIIRLSLPGCEAEVRLMRTTTL